MPLMMGARRLAILPARSGSTRIRKKNIVNFCGRPLLSYPLRAAKESHLFDEIHVSTDGSDIADVAAAEGQPVAFMRDDAMARNGVPVIVVLRWVIEQFARRGATFDEVCLLMATAPLIEAQDLIAAHDAFLANDRRLPVLSVAPFPAPVERALIVESDGVMRFANPEFRTRHSQDLRQHYFDAGAFAWFTRQQLLESAEAVYTEYVPYVLELYKATDINEPRDLVMAEVLFRGASALRDAGRNGGGVASRR